MRYLSHRNIVRPVMMLVNIKITSNHLQSKERKSFEKKGKKPKKKNKNKNENEKRRKCIKKKI